MVALGYVFSYKALQITNNIENFILMVFAFVFAIQILMRVVPWVYEFVVNVKKN